MVSHGFHMYHRMYPVLSHGYYMDISVSLYHIGQLVVSHGHHMGFACIIVCIPCYHMGITWIMDISASLYHIGQLVVSHGYHVGIIEMCI